MAKKVKNKNAFQVTLPPSITAEFWKLAADVQESVPHLLRDLAVTFIQLRKEYKGVLGIREVMMRAAGLTTAIQTGGYGGGDPALTERRTEVTQRFIDDGAKLAKKRIKEIQREMKKNGIEPSRAPDRSSLEPFMDEATNSPSVEEIRKDLDAEPVTE